jgi:hypothetical protein
MLILCDVTYIVPNLVPWAHVDQAPLSVLSPFVPGVHFVDIFSLEYIGSLFIVRVMYAVNVTSQLFRRVLLHSEVIREGDAGLGTA